MKRKGFTLIELLIVVAIIAILAAIAVPNFLEAQVRAKVSRAKADLRTYATAMESYIVDHNVYPPCNNFGLPFQGGFGDDYIVLERLSTPVSFITNGLLNDPFFAKLRSGSEYIGDEGDGSTQGGLAGIYPASNGEKTYHYQSGTNDNRASASSIGAANDFGAVNWVLTSSGPDLVTLNMGGILANNSASADGRSPAVKTAYALNLIYDTTNGTVSWGEVWRSGGSTNGDYATFIMSTVQNVQ